MNAWLVSVRRSSRPSKKYVAIFADGRQVHFGGKDYKNFIQYTESRGTAYALQKRAAYIARHSATEPWTDPYAAGTLSRYILWEYASLTEAVKKYNERFFPNH